MRCEHEINLIDEHWIKDREVDVTAECSLCGTKFRGVLMEDKE